MFSGNQPTANKQFYSDLYTELQFGRLAQIFVHISNYTKYLVQQNSLFGIPVQRPLFMEYPVDDLSWTITYQYMFGEDVLVAPAIESNITNMSVYLPPGSWKFIWNNTRTHTGSQYVNVPAPLGKPPAFYKATSRWSLLFQEIESKFPLIPPPPLPPTSSTKHSPVNLVDPDNLIG